MKIHRRNTYKDGAERMLKDKSWHSSRPLDNLKPGDILSVKNKDTGENVQWRITIPGESLGRVAAEEEWRRNPFGSELDAIRYQYYPFVIRNLEKIN